MKIKLIFRQLHATNLRGFDELDRTLIQYFLIKNILMEQLLDRLPERDNKVHAMFKFFCLQPDFCNHVSISDVNSVELKHISL